MDVMVYFGENHHVSPSCSLRYEKNIVMRYEFLGNILRPITSIFHFAIGSGG